MQRRGGALLLAALLLCGCAHRAGALKVAVHPRSADCFTFHVDDSHYLIPGGPRLEGALILDPRSHLAHPGSVTGTLTSPNGKVMWSQAHIDSEASFDVGAPGGESGPYKLCLHNHGSGDVLVDLVYFTLGHLREPSVNLHVPKGTQDSRNKQMARKDHLDGLKMQVTLVGQLVDVLAGEQRYLRRKLDRHIITCKSNNRRALGYTTLEVAAAGVVGAWNVYYVSKLFKGAGRYGRIVV